MRIYKRIFVILIAPVKTGEIAYSAVFCGMVYSRVNSAKQIVGIKRLVKEQDGTVGKCALPDLPVAMAGNDNNGQLWILTFHAALQLEALHSWHAHVGDEATCLDKEAGLQSVFSAGERCCAEVG
jgi:hypothetical protein